VWHQMLLPSGFIGMFAGDRAKRNDFNRQPGLAS
jgi:hypothetical protein